MKSLKLSDQFQIQGITQADIESTRHKGGYEIGQNKYTGTIKDGKLNFVVDTFWGRASNNPSPHIYGEFQNTESGECLNIELKAPRRYYLALSLYIFMGAIFIFLSLFDDWSWRNLPFNIAPILLLLFAYLLLSYLFNDWAKEIKHDFSLLSNTKQQEKKQ